MLIYGCADVPFFIDVPIADLQSAQADALRMYSESGDPAYHGLGNLSEERSVELCRRGKEAEYALSRYLYEPWTAFGEKSTDYTKPDVGSCLCVRSSKHENPRLIIRDADIRNHSGHKYVLVRERDAPGKEKTHRRFDFLGYFICDRAFLKDEWRTNFGNDRHEQWGIPASDLTPIYPDLTEVIKI